MSGWQHNKPLPLDMSWGGSSLYLFVCWLSQHLVSLSGGYFNILWVCQFVWWLSQHLVSLSVCLLVIPASCESVSLSVGYLSILWVCQFVHWLSQHPAHPSVICWLSQHLVSPSLCLLVVSALHTVYLSFICWLFQYLVSPSICLLVISVSLESSICLLVTSTVCKSISWLSQHLFNLPVCLSVISTACESFSLYVSYLNSLSVPQFVCQLSQQLVGPSVMSEMRTSGCVSTFLKEGQLTQYRCDTDTDCLAHFLCLTPVPQLFSHPHLLWKDYWFWKIFVLPPPFSFWSNTLISFFFLFSSVFAWSDIKLL